mmetsp:Transcript_49328/g.81910  ORF Transcript_49328/g.81910 Transcript_49328/m.81910 type:complete len:214 (+) Transcript_49328:771-1412(+)
MNMASIRLRSMDAPPSATPECGPSSSTRLARGFGLRTVTTGRSLPSRSPRVAARITTSSGRAMILSTHMTHGLAMRRRWQNTPPRGGMAPGAGRTPTCRWLGCKDKRPMSQPRAGTGLGTEVLCSQPSPSSAHILGFGVCSQRLSHCRSTSPTRAPSTACGTLSQTSMHSPSTRLGSATLAQYLCNLTEASRCGPPAYKTQRATTTARAPSSV